MLVKTFLIETRGVQMAFHFPFLGKHFFHTFFTLDGNDDDGLVGVRLESGKSGMEEIAYLLELIGDGAGFFFAGRSVNSEMSAAEFNPVFSGG